MSDSLTLTPAFKYYYVAQAVWPQVSNLLQNDSSRQLQFVPQGSSVLTTAGKAGTWLGKAGKKLTQLIIIGHGGPGEFFLGERITSGNVAALGGWLESFFESDATGVQILGCSSAADSMYQIGAYEYGQDLPLNDPSASHRGYDLLRKLAWAAGQRVEGAMNGQLIAPMRLQGRCRRVYPSGFQEFFNK
jgi:hypothetical protein